MGVALAHSGRRVLLIDADPQGDLTTYMGWHNSDNIPITLSTLMGRTMNDMDVNPTKAVLHHDEGVDLIPTNLELASMEVSLVNAMSREYTLRNSISELKDKYDFILIDCMPSLGMITINALASADKVIIPVQSEFLTAKGMSHLMNTITYETKVEKYKAKTIDSRVHVELSGNSHYQRPTASDIKHYDVETETEVEKRVLHIYINAVSTDTLKTKYNFNATQLKQFEELSSDKYTTMWASAIYGVYGSGGEISTWKQKGREWSNIRIGNTSKTIGDVGCLVTSVSILIKKSGVPTKDIYSFNPGTFVTALNNVYGFDGANLQYGPISKVVPGFVYQDRVILRGKEKSEKFATIKKYYENGYYLAIEVAGATETEQHWVALDYVTDNKIIMLDPGSEATDMWKQYDWNKTTQFVYFKATK